MAPRFVVRNSSGHFKHMEIVAPLGMTIAYASVCAFFTALIIGMWYGVVKYVRENSSMLFSSNHTKGEKLFKLLSFCVMVSIVLTLTSTNLVFWANTSDVFKNLRGRDSACSCSHR